jgi:hypothetical protein
MRWAEGGNVLAVFKGSLPCVPTKATTPATAMAMSTLIKVTWHIIQL